MGSTGLLDSTFNRPVDKGLSLPLHLLGLFLAHSPTQQISGSKTETGQLLCNLHYLLLIQDHSVGWLQDGFNTVVQIDHRLAAVFSIDEIINHSRLQRTRPKQRHQRN